MLILCHRFIERTIVDSAQTITAARYKLEFTLISQGRGIDKNFCKYQSQNIENTSYNNVEALNTHTLLAN